MTGGPTIVRALEQWAGLDATALGPSSVSDAVSRHAKGPGEDEDAFAARLARDAAARARWLEDLLVHETSFFRYPASFDLLTRHVQQRAARRAGPVRILDAGCSTGQESISVVIALLEGGLDASRLVVDAVDLSEPAAQRAREGRFERGALRGLSAPRRARWFDAQGGAFVAKPEVMACLRVTTGSVLDPFPSSGSQTPAKFDAILCRNLLIYLTAPARRQALEAIGRALADDGLLLVGHAEVLAAREAGFVPVEEDGTFALVRAVARTTPAATLAEPPSPRKAESKPTGSHARSPERRRRTKGTAAAPPEPGRETARETTEAATLLERARRQADAGRHDDAKKLVLEMLRVHGANADAYCLLAVLERAAGHGLEAERAVTRALYLDPSHREALLLAALGADERGDRPMSARLRARAALSKPEASS